MWRKHKETQKEGENRVPVYLRLSVTSGDIHRCHPVGAYCERASGFKLSGSLKMCPYVRLRIGLYSSVFFSFYMKDNASWSQPDLRMCWLTWHNKKKKKKKSPFFTCDVEIYIHCSRWFCGTYIMIWSVAFWTHFSSCLSGLKLRST